MEFLKIKGVIENKTQNGKLFNLNIYQIINDNFIEGFLIQANGLDLFIETDNQEQALAIFIKRLFKNDNCKVTYSIIQERISKNTKKIDTDFVQENARDIYITYDMALMLANYINANIQNFEDVQEIEQFVGECTFYDLADNEAIEELSKIAQENSLYAILDCLLNDFNCYLHDEDYVIKLPYVFN